MVSDIFMPSSKDKLGELSLSGAERVLLEESRALSGKGNRVYMISRRMEKEGTSYVFEGIDVNTFYAIPSLKPGFLVNSLKSPRTLFSAINDRIDIINYHQPFSAYSLNSFGKSSAIPSVYTCHSLGHEEYATRCAVEKGNFSFADYSLVIPAMKYIEKFNFKKSRRIRVLSEYTSRRLRRFCPVPESKINVIPGGVDKKKFILHSGTSLLKKRLAIPEGKIIFSTLRNMEPRMGLENLIEAAEIVRKRDDSAIFVIGGSGPLKTKLVNAVQSKGLSSSVYFTGYLDEKDLPAFYSLSDFFILPTIEQEGFGLVTVESLACGTPVLGTPVAATPEILSDVEKELIFTSVSPEAMADGILKWIGIFRNKKDFYGQTSLRGKNVVDEQYTWERSADKLIELYESIL